VSRKELIEHYRTQAARYKQLAGREHRSSVREGLLDLARQCDAMAQALAAPVADQSAKPELSKDEFLVLVNRVIVEEKSVPTAPIITAPGSRPPNSHQPTEVRRNLPSGEAAECPRSPSVVGVVRELSLDEILQKIQRDIAEGR
jgi:hypothetical protein